MRIEVLMGTEQVFAEAVTCPADSPDCLDSILQTNSAEQADVVCFKSVVPSKTQSENFSVIGDMMRVMLTFMDEHSYPQRIRIVCDNDETARLYKVIYNFWFAEEKSERMDDDSWD